MSLLVDKWTFISITIRHRDSTTVEYFMQILSSRSFVKCAAVGALQTTLGSLLHGNISGRNILDGLANASPVIESNKGDLFVLAPSDKIWTEYMLANCAELQRQNEFAYPCLPLQRASQFPWRQINRKHRRRRRTW